MPAVALPAPVMARLRERPALAAAVLRAAGMEALAVVREAFVVKARGGADEAGISWRPLDPRTVAYGRRHPGLNAKRARAAKAGRPGRPLLTAAQDKLWRGVFAGTYRRLKAKGVADAGGNAAARAWAVVKAAGGKTVLGEYGKARVEVGRDTGRLLASLGPGAALLLDAGGLSVRVGTNVAYAERFHKGRPLWPDVWPRGWLVRIRDAALGTFAALEGHHGERP